MHMGTHRAYLGEHLRVVGLAAAGDGGDVPVTGGVAARARRAGRAYAPVNAMQLPCFGATRRVRPTVVS